MDCRRIKLRRIAPDHLIELYPLDCDLYEIRESDHHGVYKTHVISAPSRRQSRVAFQQWLDNKYPRPQ
jgi:hypothetical protein